MVRNRKRTVAEWSLTCCLLFLMVLGCGDRDSGKTIVARVGNESLTMEEIDILTTTGGRPALSFEEKREFIQQWIDTEVLYREALKQKVDTDPRIRKAILQMKKELLAAELMERRIGSEMAIPDVEIETYYRQHQDDYTITEPLRRARHILVESREQAVRVRGRLLNDELFESLVVELSLDYATHETGGDLGFFTREEISPEIASAAFALNVGDISEPIRTEWGYHVIEVTEILPEGSVMPLDEVKNEIANVIYAAKQRQAFDTLLKELKQDEAIEVHWDLIQSEPENGQPEKTRGAE